jgi:FdhE protein
MAYVAVLGEKREELLAIAERRWAGIAEERPDLAPALALQRRLLALIAGLVVRLDRDRPPRLSLPARYLAAKLARGVPVLAGEPIPLPIAVLSPALPEFCDALAEGGAGDAARRLRDAISGGDVDAGSLLAASLSRHQAAIRIGATHRGLAPDLVWLVAELAVGPFVHALQSTLLESAKDETLRSALAAWDHGYCPACGSWPALAEVVTGQRALRCSFCSSAWEPQTCACIYCEEAGEKFVSAAPDERREDRRLEACGACGGYLKTMDVASLSPFPLVSISDIETTDLDLAAMERGYQRPALKEFGNRLG